MSRLMLVLALSVPLVVFTAASKAQAWGGYNPPPSYPPAPKNYHWDPNSSDLPLYPQEGVFQHNPPSSYGNGGHPYAGEQEGNSNFSWGGWGYGGYGYGDYAPGYYRGWGW